MGHGTVRYMDSSVYNSTLSPRIYVASMSDYNAGTLHGVWIDDVTDVDVINEAVQEMLKASPEAARFPEGGPAEEWAIHDYEGFGKIKLSEYQCFEDVVQHAAMIEAHGPAWAAYAEYVGNDFTEDDFEESYNGEHDSEKDFAEQLADDLGSIPEDLSWPLSYIDWEGATRELFMGDYYSVRSDHHTVYVFRSL